MTVVPQHMQALARANEKRIGIGNLRREIRSLGLRDGARRAARAIQTEADDPNIGSARIGHLLRAVPYLGQSRVTRCLLTARVMSADKKLRDLTPRQREAIAIQLMMWAERSTS